MSARVFGFYGQSGNNALKDASALYARGFQARGFEVELFDLTQSSRLERLHQAFETGNVRFGFGVQGVGSLAAWNDAGNIWERYRTPFVGLHHDHPCNNLALHQASSRWVGNLYHFRSFLEDKLRYLPSAQLSQATPFRFLEALPPADIPFEKRPIRLLYLKTGIQPQSFLRLFVGLSTEVQQGILDLIAQASINPNLSLCDLVSAYFVRLHIDWRAQAKLFWYIVCLIDNFVRAQHALLFVRWLMKQNGAVIVGDGWDFLDKTGARAEFRPAVDIRAVNSLYQQSQIVCNTNPQGYDFVHERVLSGLAFGACVISDSNIWWRTHMSHVPALALFDWNAPLDAQLDAALASCNAEAAATGPAVAEEVFGGDPFEKIIAFAEEVRAFATS